jgi:hypothetical protein
VLLQQGQPVAFLSKALGPSHKASSIYEKEFLALIMAVEKWRSYLQLQEFIIKTDHKSLSYLIEQNLHSEMQRKAMTRLMGLKFKIVYRQGKENVVADSLSRMGHLMALQAVSEVRLVDGQGCDSGADMLREHSQRALHSLEVLAAEQHLHEILHAGKEERDLGASVRVPDRGEAWQREMGGGE